MLFAAVSLVAVVLVSSWGFLVHRSVNQLAIYQLPKEVQPFFYENVEYLVREAIRPDVRRNDDKTEDKKHFIDFEAYGDSAAWNMPWSWNEAVKKYGRDSLLEYGYAPYEIMAVKEKLTGAFRKQNKDSILFYAADLGHYLADINVPLHTSLNYDGQLTGQKGLHSLWESMIPELELKNYNLSSRHKARYLKNPEAQVWGAARRSFNLTKDLFRLEAEVSKNFTPEQKYRTQIRRDKEVKTYTTAFAKAYSKSLGNTINNQLIAATNLIADMWFTSWVDAGKPDLSKLLKTGQTKAAKKALCEEKKMFKKNKLIKNGKLISLKDVKKDSD